jgi:hypothetical protein
MKNKALQILAMWIAAGTHWVSDVSRGTPLDRTARGPSA